MKDGSCHTHSHKTFYLLGCYNVEAMVTSKDLEALAQGRGEEKDTFIAAVMYTLMSLACDLF